MMSVGTVVEAASTATTVQPDVAQQTNLPNETTSSCAGSTGCDEGIVLGHLTVYHGYAMFIGMAVISFFIAKGSLAIRHRIYRVKVSSREIKCLS
jgi:hypothetical protein